MAGMVSTGAVLFAHADASKRTGETITAEQVSAINLIDPVVTGSVPGAKPADIETQGRTLLELCDAQCQAKRLDKWTRATD